MSGAGSSALQGISPGVGNPSGFWSGAGGAIGAAGLGFLQSGLQFGLGDIAADKAWKRQKTVLRNQIQWRVADLKDAGLNPILAAGGSLGGGGASSVPLQRQVTGDGSGLANSAIKGRLVRREMDALDARTQESLAGSIRNMEQAQAAQSQAALTQTENLIRSTALPEAQARASVDRTPLATDAIKARRALEHTTGLAKPVTGLIGDAAKSAAGVLGAQKARRVLGK